MVDNKTYIQMRKDFYEIYKTKIVPIVREFEPERIKLKRKRSYLTFFSFFVALVLFCFIGGFVLLPALLIVAASGILNSKWIFILVGILLLAGLIKISTVAACTYGDSVKKKFENKIKKIVMPYFCESFDDLTWSSSPLYDDKFSGSYNEIEEHIAAARRFYNSAALELKNAVEIFPSSMFAAMLNIKATDFFKAEEKERQAINAADFLK